MGCTHNKNQDGFTLVEISIVMVIIGLLIGGTFGGLKLIENMRINKTVQDLKGIESAALTFKDTYGRLPGDMPNTAARLPNCNDAPCATGGNGNRRLDNIVGWNDAVTATQERFTFWHHIQAADLLSLVTANTTDLSFGEGQPKASVGGGMRLTNLNGWVWIVGTTQQYQATSIFVGVADNATLTTTPPQLSVPCSRLGAVDQKMDDGTPYNGSAGAWQCGSVVSPASVYDRPNRLSAIWYDLKGF
jgi:prepilin-type N-terminal cleavage/methylation domain-containing protein